MRAMYRDAFGEELDPSAGGPHASVDMSEFEATSGAEFDRVFLRMMSAHASAITMSESVTMGEPREEVETLANEIIAAQSKDIGEIRSGASGSSRRLAERPRRTQRRGRADVSRSVLVVDDEPGMIEMASAYLRRDGFVVRTAATGQRALDAVLTEMPDLVVLDLMLPDIPGEEVARPSGATAPCRS